MATLTTAALEYVLWPHYLLCLHLARQVSGEAKAVVKSLLASSSAKRPSAPQLLDMPWVKGEGRWP